MPLLFLFLLSSVFRALIVSCIFFCSLVLFFFFSFFFFFSRKTNTLIIFSLSLFFSLFLGGILFYTTEIVLFFLISIFTEQHFCNLSNLFLSFDRVQITKKSEYFFWPSLVLWYRKTEIILYNNNTRQLIIQRENKRWNVL